MKTSRLEELRNDIKVLKRFTSILWSKKSVYIKYSIVAVVLALVVTLSIPKTYSSSAMLVPENYPTGANAGMVSLAGMLGVNMNYLTKDAYTVDMYPMIVSSSDFLTRLGGIDIKIPEAGIDTTYSAHLVKNRKIAWWGYPSRWVKGLFTAEQPVIRDNMANDIIRNNVRCEVDKLRGVILITVYDQYPVACKQVADSVICYLNEFVQEYRTKKTATDYNAVALLTDSLQADYLVAQQRYKEYVAANQGANDALYKQQCAFLEGETELAYAAYMQMMTQKQTAKIKLLESAPVYTVIESPNVPQAPALPAKFIIYVLFLLVAIVVATIKITYTAVLCKK